MAFGVDTVGSDQTNGKPAMTEILHATQTHAASRRKSSRRKHPWMGMLARMRMWRIKRRTRRRLADLEAWMLRDIGMTQADAMREVRVSFPWHLSFPWRDATRPPDPWC